MLPYDTVRHPLPNEREPHHSAIRTRSGSGCREPRWQQSRYFTFVALAVPAAVRIAAADLVADAEPHPPLIDLSDVTDAQTALDRIDRVVRGAGLATPLARLRVNSTALATTQHCGVVRYGLVAELTAARSRTALPSTALGRFSAGLREASGLTSQLRVSPPVPLTAWEIDGVRQNEPINSLEARPAVGAVVTRAAQLQIPRSPSELARLFDGLKPHTYTRLLFTTNQPILLDATPIRPARPATWSIKAAPPLDLWR
jgi:hypothetical protein